MTCVQLLPCHGVLKKSKRVFLIRCELRSRRFCKRGIAFILLMASILLMGHLRVNNSGVSEEYDGIRSSPAPLTPPLKPKRSNASVLHVGDMLVRYPVLPRNVDTCPDDTYIMILVMSHPNNTERRSLLRKTWMSQQERSNMNQARVFSVFYVGNAGPEEGLDRVFVESRCYGDILMTDVHDGYKNLTRKVLSAYAWARQWCSTAIFIIKVDDDTMVNHYRLPEFLSIYLSGQTTTMREGHLLVVPKLVIGPLIKEGSPVWRDESTKWFVPQHLYKEDVYPAYPSGYFYAVTASYADCLLAYIGNTTSDTWITVDDAFIGGILAVKLNATLRLSEVGRTPGLFGFGDDVPADWMMRSDANKSMTHMDAPVAVTEISHIIHSDAWATISLLYQRSQLNTKNAL